MNISDIRLKVAEKIAGQPIPDSAGVFGIFTLASYLNEDAQGRLLRSSHALDRFVKTNKAIIKKSKQSELRIEQFLDEVMSDRVKFARLYDMGYGNNKLVRNGIRMLSRWFLDIATTHATGGVSITTRIGYIQLGTNPTTVHDPSYNGCVTPTSAAGLTESAGVVTQEDTDSNYPKDTYQIRKTDFVNSSGAPVNIAEAAIRNNDDSGNTRAAFCRSAVTTTQVANSGNLDVTYQFRIVP